MIAPGLPVEHHTLASAQDQLRRSSPKKSADWNLKGTHRENILETHGRIKYWHLLSAKYENLLEIVCYVAQYFAIVLCFKTKLPADLHSWKLSCFICTIAKWSCCLRVSKGFPHSHGLWCFLRLQSLANPKPRLASIGLKLWLHWPICCRIPSIFSCHPAAGSMDIDGSTLWCHRTYSNRCI